MKAIRIHTFGGPEVLQLEQIPDPNPSAGQVLVRIQAIGINPVEVYIRSGSYPRKPALPYTPGSDAAGVVAAVGADVSSVRVGDRVYLYGSVTGAYADTALCDTSQVYALPKAASFAQGAAMGVPYSTAYYGLFFRGHGAPGETLLVHGASGGVGSAAVQIARARGLKVIGTAGTPKGRDLIIKEGAHYALDHHEAGYLDQVLKFTDGRGVDLILEMLANVNLGKDLKVLSPKGRVVVIGSRGPVEIDPRDTMGRNADIRGMSLFNATPAELASIHAALAAGLENGSLRPVVGQEIPLAEAARAHEALQKAGAYGKIVLVP